MGGGVEGGREGVWRMGDGRGRSKEWEMVEDEKGGSEGV